MPKKSRIKINLDLLRPQSQPQQIAVKLFRWLLSSGRYLIIGVEIIVLGAFLLRFKLDGDIAATREAIEAQVPFIKSLAADEKLIRLTQFQLTIVKETKQTSSDFPDILSRVAKQTPSGVSLKALSMDSLEGTLNMKLSATATDNSQLASFMAGLKSDQGFSNLNLADVSFEGGNINFSISTTVKTIKGGKL